MNEDFKKYQTRLKAAMASSLPSEQNRFAHFDRILKGDFSGIQKFVFRVSSKKAAKTLKGRSEFIKSACQMAERLVCDQYEAAGNLKDDIELIYNSGGQFYLLYKSFEKEKEWFEGLQKTMRQAFLHEEMTISIAKIPLDYEEKRLSDRQIRDRIEKESSIVKHQNRAFELFNSPFKRPISDWEGWAQTLINAAELHTEKIASTAAQTGFLVGEEAISVFGYRQYSTRKRNKETEQNPFGLPAWKADKLDWAKEIKRDDPEEDEPKAGGLISFFYLAKLAAERTGTEKLGILKLDVDNLGHEFRERPSLDDAQKMAQSIQWFFEKYLLEELVQKGSFGNGHLFSENIYVVFSGGDDAFLVGGWDAVFEIARQIQTRFEEFAPKNQDDNPRLTISAALLIVGSSFPVVRFAELAEERLSNAKARPGKNAINVFGKTIVWKDFSEKAYNHAHLLERLIKQPQRPMPRSILERFEKSAAAIDYAFENQETDDVAVPPIWNLLYSMREVHDRKALDPMLSEWQKTIFYEWHQRTENRNYTIPVAVRWAEFLTKQKK